MDIVKELERIHKEKYLELTKIYKSRAGANDVDDIIQEGFYRALLYKNSFNPELQSTEVWLGGIFNNCLNDLLREKQNGRGLHLDSAEVEKMSVEWDVTYGCDMEVLKSELYSRPYGERVILHYYFICEYAVKEIKLLVSSNTKTISSIVYKFKSAMQEEFACGI